MPQLNPEEAFEDDYTRAFRQRFSRRGIAIKYERDRAATDVGIHLTAPGSLELSSVRVWFQLKGKHSTTLSRDKIDERDFVPIAVSLNHARFWYAAPEAVYLVVFLEATDEFIAEDIRDIVDRQFAGLQGNFLAPTTFPNDQDSVTLHLNPRAILDEDRIDKMLSHKSMRIDGPVWRGRPLGHRYDPLRCELAYQDPQDFVELVEAILEAHDFRIERHLDASKLVAGVAEGTDEAFLAVGSFYATYEWPFQMSVEFGTDPGTDLRNEGQIFRVQGRTAVLIHSKLGAHPRPAPEAEQLIAELQASGIEHVLVIGNAPSPLLIGSYRAILRDLYIIPQDQGSLAYTVLTTTMVFLAFQESLKWKYVNYLWASQQPTSVRFGRQAR